MAVTHGHSWHYQCYTRLLVLWMNGKADNICWSYVLWIHRIPFCFYRLRYRSCSPESILWCSVTNIDSGCRVDHLVFVFCVCGTYFHVFSRLSDPLIYWQQCSASHLNASWLNPSQNSMVITVQFVSSFQFCNWHLVTWSSYLPDLCLSFGVSRHNNYHILLVTYLFWDFMSVFGVFVLPHRIVYYVPLMSVVLLFIVCGLKYYLSILSRV